jgi:hypothetical protein
MSLSYLIHPLLTGYGARDDVRVDFLTRRNFGTSIRHDSTRAVLVGDILAALR